MTPELFEMNNAKYRLDFELSALMMLARRTSGYDDSYQKQSARVRVARQEYLQACSAHNAALETTSGHHVHT